MNNKSKSRFSGLIEGVSDNSLTSEKKEIKETNKFLEKPNRFSNLKISEEEGDNTFKKISFY